MSSTAPTRICRSCYSEIERRARKCPHCLSLQGRYIAIPIMAIVVLSGFALFVVLAIRMESAFWRGGVEHRAINYADRVSVLNSRVVLLDDGKQRKVSIVGAIRNEAAVALDEVSLEVQCFNSDDELVDSILGFVRDLPVGQEVSFKAVGYDAPPAEPIASHRVIVRRASANWPTD